MFCPKCGKELIPGARFCDACGTRVDSGEPPSTPQTESATNGQTGLTTTDIYADSIQNGPGPEPQKPRKNRLALKIIAVIAAAAILLSGIAVLGYHTFLPARTTLKVAQYFTVQKAWKQLDQAMARNRQKIDALYSTPVKTDTKVTLDLDSNIFTAFGMDSSLAELFLDLLKDFSVQYTTETDFANKKENLSVSLNYLNNPAVTLNLFLDNNRFGINLPELSQKSIVGRFSDLARLEEMYPGYFSGFGALADMDPWFSYGMARELSVESEDLKKLMETYGMFLVNNVEGRNMSIKRGKKVEIQGKDLHCQEVTITLSQKEQLELVKTLLDTMKEDDLLYDAVFSKLARIFEAVVASDPSGNLKTLGADNIFSKSQVRLMFSSLKSYLTKDMFPDELKIKVYINGLDVVKYELEIPMEDTDESLVLAAYESLADESGLSTIGFSLNYLSYGDRINAYLALGSRYDDKNDTGYVNVEFIVDFSGSYDGNIRLTATSSQELEDSNTVNGNFELALDFDVDYESGSFIIEADTVQVRNKNGMPESIDMTALVSLDIPSVLPQPLSLTVRTESDIQYGVSVKSPDWANDAIDLATVSKKELDSFAEDIEDTIDSIMQLVRYMY